MVHFEVIGRKEIVWDSATTEDDRVIDETKTPAGDGTYLIPQPIVEHSGELGDGFKVGNPTSSGSASGPDEAYEGPRADTAVALPGQTTTIRMKFDRSGLYVWVSQRKKIFLSTKLIELAYLTTQIISLHLSIVIS